jgi:hypothetical protein
MKLELFLIVTEKKGAAKHRGKALYSSKSMSREEDNSYRERHNTRASKVPPSSSSKVNQCGPAMTQELHATWGRARATTLMLPHGPLYTPVFMPVGTQGTVKGMTSEQLTDRPHDFKIILGNTYHLALRPTTELLEELGGLHKFMNWPRNILTDSGGFQMVSLLELAKIEEEGVTFRSPVDGTQMLLKPEDSIHHQNRIGSDIMMALDDVVSVFLKVRFYCHEILCIGLGPIHNRRPCTFQRSYGPHNSLDRQMHFCSSSAKRTKPVRHHSRWP